MVYARVVTQEFSLVTANNVNSFEHRFGNIHTRRDISIKGLVCDSIIESG